MVTSERGRAGYRPVEEEDHTENERVRERNCRMDVREGDTVGKVYHSGAMPQAVKNAG